MEGSLVVVPEMSSTGGGFSLVATAGEPVLPRPSVDASGVFAIDPPAVVQTAASPTLFLIREGASYRLRWFSVVPGWVVETTSNLLQPVWSPLAATPARTADQFEIDLGVPATTQFYRLRRTAPGSG